MSNERVTDSQVKQFIRDWFSQLNIHPPVSEMLPFMANEKLSMKMPEKTFCGHEGFKEWYEGVNKFFDQVHDIKGLEIKTEENKAKVKVIVYRERSISNTSGAGIERAGFYAAQTWEVERSAQSHKLYIVTYNVDYFLPKVNLDK